MKMKYNGKKETKKTIVHDREPPDSSSRHMPKNWSFQAQGHPRKNINKNKTSSKTQARNNNKLICIIEKLKNH